MKKRIFLLLIIGILLCAGCAGRTVAPQETQDAEPRRFEASFLDVFDTVTQAVLYEPDKATAEARAERIHTLLQQYHRLFDIYHEYEGLNNLYTINANAGVAPVAVDRRLIELILYAKEMYALTDGRMNIAMGSVLSVWHDYREAGIDQPEHAKLPPMTALAEAACYTSIDDVIVDEAAGTVYLADPAMRLDVGAIGKGFACARVTERLRSDGAESLLLSVGGNVSGIGMRGDGLPWKVGVQSPDMTGYLCYVAVGDKSLVSSGDYQRYYTVDGKRYHHIIDPDTLMPADFFSSVSVLADDSGLADALSTALFTLPLADGRALVESIPGVEAAWLSVTGELEYSSGFSDCLLNQ